MKLFLAIALLASLASCDGEVMLNYKNQQEVMKYLKVVLKQEGLMKCIVKRDIDHRPDSKCLVMFNVERKLEAIVSMISSVIVDVIYKNKACNWIEQKLNKANCKEVIRLDIRKRFHLEFHSRAEEVFVAKIVTRLFNYLLVVKREKEQHLNVDVEQKLNYQKAQDDEDLPARNKILFNEENPLEVDPIVKRPLEEKAPVFMGLGNPQEPNEDEIESEQPQEPISDYNEVYRRPENLKPDSLRNQQNIQPPADQKVASIDAANFSPEIMQAIVQLAEKQNKNKNPAVENGSINDVPYIDDDQLSNTGFERNPVQNQNPGPVNRIVYPFTTERELPEVKKASEPDHLSKTVQL